MDAKKLKRIYTVVKNNRFFFCLFQISALLLCTGAFLDRQTDRQKSRQTDQGTKELGDNRTDERTDTKTEFG